MKRVILNMAAVLGIAVLALCMTQPANAAAVTIDFGTGGTSGGTVTLNVGNVAVGSNITIGVMNVANAPDGNGPYNPISALLNFNTSTGAISITSTAAMTVNGNVIPSGTVLLSGTDTFSVGMLGTSLSITGSGPDTKSPLLLAALGLPTNAPFDLSAFSLSANPVVGGNGYVWTATSTDVLNTETPEPGTLVMFGSGLLGLAGIIRRKLSV